MPEIESYSINEVGQDDGESTVEWEEVTQSAPKDLVNPDTLVVVSEEHIEFDPKTMGYLITGLGEYRDDDEDIVQED